MTEIEIFKEIRNLETQLHILEIKIKVWRDEKEKLDLIKRSDTLKDDIKKLKSQLDSLNDKKYSEEAKFAIIRHLEEYISEISEGVKEQESSDNQEVPAKSNLIVMIYKDLYSFLPDKGSGDRTLGTFVETTTNKHSPDRAGLTDFLNDEVQIMSNMVDPDYLTLRQYFSGLKERIIKRFNG